jgi:hypothetical protein
LRLCSNSLMPKLFGWGEERSPEPGEPSR